MTALGVPYRPAEKTPIKSNDIYKKYNSVEHHTIDYEISQLSSYIGSVNELDCDTKQQQQQENRKIQILQKFRKIAHKEKILLAFFIFFLFITTTSERLSFKLLVNRLEPFSAAVVIGILIVHSITLGIILLYKEILTEDIIDSMRLFPWFQIFAIATLDNLQLYLMMISAAEISPTYTVILLQFSIPMTCAISKISYFQGNEPIPSVSSMRLIGCLLVLASQIICLIPTISEFGEKINDPIKWSVLMYAASNIPGAISTIYKEKSIREFSQPLDLYYLNFWIAFAQLILAFLLFPFAFHLQQVLNTENFTYSTSMMINNLKSSFDCWFTSQEIIYSDLYVGTNCSNALGFILWFIISSIGMSLSVEFILKWGSMLVMYRVTTVSILFCFFFLGIFLGPSNGIGNTSIGMFNLISVFILIFGLELYHKEQSPEIQFTTVWIPPPLPTS